MMSECERERERKGGMRMEGIRAVREGDHQSGRETVNVEDQNGSR